MRPTTDAMLNVVPASLLVGEFEQVERALDVDAVGGVGGELGAGAEQRSQVIDFEDFVLADQSGEQVFVEDVAADCGGAVRAESLVELVEIEGDDAAVGSTAQVLDQPLANLSVGAGNQHDGFTHDRTRSSGVFSLRVAQVCNL